MIDADKKVIQQLERMDIESLIRLKKSAAFNKRMAGVAGVLVLLFVLYFPYFILLILSTIFVFIAANISVSMSRVIELIQMQIKKKDK